MIRPSVKPAHQRRLTQLFARMREKARVQAQTDSRDLSSLILGGGGTTLLATALSGDVIGAIHANTVQSIRHYEVSPAAPADGQALVWSAGAGTAGMWVPGAPGDPTGQIIDYSPLVNQALPSAGASASASSTASGFDPDDVIDNSEATYHATAQAATPPPDPITGAWIEVDLGSAKAITYARWNGAAGQVGHGAVTYEIQSSPDNATWAERASGTFVGAHDTGYLDLGGAVTARYWRFILTSGPTDEATRYYTLATFTLALYSGAALVQAPGHIVADEGAPVLQRRILDFRGAAVSVMDDALASATVVSISGAGVTDATYVTRSAHASLSAEVLLSEVYAHELKTRYEPISTGGGTPELIFTISGDCLVAEVEN